MQCPAPGPARCLCRHMQTHQVVRIQVTCARSRARLSAGFLCCRAQAASSNGASSPRMIIVGSITGNNNTVAGKLLQLAGQFIVRVLEAVPLPCANLSGLW